MQRGFQQVALLLLLAAVPAALAALLHPKRPTWNSGEVTLAVAKSWGEATLWVDARPRADYDRDHIPGAWPLSEEAWDEDLRGLIDAWTPERIVVVYCSSLSCRASHDVARRLREDVELSRVFVLQGGWEAWRSQTK